jgi:hypothetical protein
VTSPGCIAGIGRPRPTTRDRHRPLVLAGRDAEPAAIAALLHAARVGAERCCSSGVLPRRALSPARRRGCACCAPSGEDPDRLPATLPPARLTPAAAVELVLGLRKGLTGAGLDGGADTAIHAATGDLLRDVVLDLTRDDRPTTRTPPGTTNARTHDPWVRAFSMSWDIASVAGAGFEPATSGL